MRKGIIFGLLIVCVGVILAAGRQADYLRVVNLTSSAASGMLENVLQALKTYRAEFVNP